MTMQATIRYANRPLGPRPRLEVIGGHQRRRVRHYETSVRRFKTLTVRRQRGCPLWLTVWNGDHTSDRHEPLCSEDDLL
jgi:hypothetical protein